jgi:hypothetical protein
MSSSKLVQSRLVATRGVQIDYRCLNNKSDTDDDNSNKIAAPLLLVIDPRLFNKLPDQAITNISSNILPSKILLSESVL